MTSYIPPAIDWVREQVELYESSGGTRGTTLRDTGLPCIIVTHTGNKTGGMRKIPLMRVRMGDSYVLIGSYGGRENNPVWVYNLRANPDVEIRDMTEVCKMRKAPRLGLGAFQILHLPQIILLFRELLEVAPRMIWTSWKNARRNWMPKRKYGRLVFSSVLSIKGSTKHPFAHYRCQESTHHHSNLIVQVHFDSRIGDNPISRRFEL